MKNENGRKISDSRIVQRVISTKVVRGFRDNVEITYAKPKASGPIL